MGNFPHKQNYFVSIFRGDFPGPQRNRNFDTWTQQTAQLDLSNEL